MNKNRLDSGLSKLTELLVLMSGFVEEAVNYSILAWRERDQHLVEKVHQIEVLVNENHKRIDAECLKLFPVAPLATDLRFVMSAVKINTDLERMVDQAVNIADTANYYLKFPILPHQNELCEMADDAQFMVREAIESFVKGDALLATNVLRCDDKVDNLKNKIFRDVINHITEHSKDAEQGLNVILIARNLERIADHATNIAEDVIFTVSGEDIRHSGKKVFLEKDGKNEKYQ